MMGLSSVHPSYRYGSTQDIPENITKSTCQCYFYWAQGHTLVNSQYQYPHYYQYSQHVIVSTNTGIKLQTQEQLTISSSLISSKFYGHLLIEELNKLKRVVLTYLEEKRFYFSQILSLTLVTQRQRQLIKNIYLSSLAETNNICQVEELEQLFIFVFVFIVLRFIIVSVIVRDEGKKGDGYCKDSKSSCSQYG